MRTITTALLASSLFFCASAAFAQDGLVATSKDGSDDEEEVIVDDRTAPAEQDALALFANTWRCTGTSSTEFGADVATSLTVTGKKDLGGRWLVVKTELTPKAKGAKTTMTQEVWGWSRADKGLVRTGASSDGGMITSTSTGWAGERFSWTGTSSQHAKSTKEKFAVEKKSDKELVVELSLGTPELHVVFEGTCKR
jgi:hypothetical protein